MPFPAYPTPRSPTFLRCSLKRIVVISNPGIGEETSGHVGQVGLKVAWDWCNLSHVEWVVA